MPAALERIPRRTWLFSTNKRVRLRMILAPRLRSGVLLVLAIGGLDWTASAPLGAVPADQAADITCSPDAASSAVAPRSEPPRVDRYGDPLPPGAAMRLGTVRFRQGRDMNHIVYSPDGQLVVTDGAQRRLQVWDARDGKKLRQIDLGIEEVRDFAVSPDWKLIAAVGFQYEPERNLGVHYLTFTNLATGRPVRRREWDEPNDVWSIAYAPQGKVVATMSTDSTIRLWDVGTMNLLRQERLGKWYVASIAFSPDRASHLLAVADERTIHLYDVAHFRDAQKIPIDAKHRLYSVAFSPDGTKLAGAMTGGQIWLWRVSDRTLLRRFASRKNPDVTAVSFSPDGKAVAATGLKRQLVLFDVATEKELDSLPNVRLAYGPMAFSPDGGTLATTGGRRALHLWDLATGNDRLATPEAHQGCATAFAFLDDGKTLVSGSDDRTVRTWDLATGRPTKMLAHDGSVRSLSVSDIGSLLATGSNNEYQATVQVWNLKTGERLHTWSVADAKSELHHRGMMLRGDGSSVIAAVSDGSLRRWDVSTGAERPVAGPAPEKEASVDTRRWHARAQILRSFFARDGRSVALVGNDGVHVVDVASGGLRFEESESTMAGEFAPDGRSLAIVRQGHPTKIKLADGHTRHDSSTAASTIVWLDTETGHVRREIVIPESRVDCLTFSPDGQTIAAGTSLQGDRGIIRIFRLRDRHETETNETPCPSITGLSFTPDGKRIVAGLSDTSIVIWDVRH